MPEPRSKRRPELLLSTLGAVMIAAAVWSAIGPEDYGVWAFELIPGGLLTAVLVLTFRRFRFSALVYVLICVQFLILATGAKYTYAEVPLFNWLRDELGFSRNHFDRVGHFVQGFVPAMIAREYLLRRTPLEKGPILFTFVVSLCLAFSAFYELVESWFVLLFYPDEGPQWLGMQGDAFDAQWDMTMALLGALLALTLLARAHDRSIEHVLALRRRPGEPAA